METYVFRDGVHVEQEEIQRVADFNLREQGQETIQVTDLLTSEEGR